MRFLTQPKLTHAEIGKVTELSGNLPEGGARQGQPAVGVLGLRHSVAPCYPAPPRTMTESDGGDPGDLQRPESKPSSETS